MSRQKERDAFVRGAREAVMQKWSLVNVTARSTMEATRIYPDETPAPAGGLIDAISADWIRRIGHIAGCRFYAGQPCSCGWDGVMDRLSLRAQPPKETKG